jgi:hypothetical protein
MGAARARRRLRGRCDRARGHRRQGLSYDLVSALGDAKKSGIGPELLTSVSVILSDAIDIGVRRERGGRRFAVQGVRRRGLPLDR